MPNGTATLMIRMYDNSLTHIIDQRQIKIYVSPPFWEQWWFIALIISIIPILVYFEFQYYIYQLKKRHSDDKIRFFLNTAHNLRNSLTLVNGPIEELNKETSLSEKGNYFLNVLTDQAQHLLKVVTGLMDFHKVDIGKEKLYRSMTDIVDLVKTRLMMNESYARSQSIDIEFKSNCSEYITAVDEIMVEKIIDNLISNAIKYSYPGKKVYVNIDCDKDKWVLEVKDEGIGISKKAQKQLFNEYYRGENAVNSKIVGSGIGLLLVKNYITLHNGRISCKSQLDAGSTFQVTIPYQDIENIEVERVDNEIMQPVSIKTDARNVLDKEKSKEQLSVTKRKILIVEDNDKLRDFLRVAMDDDFIVSVASDGEKAWNLINKESFELVISDILMPGLDGFELCSKIKSSFETSHIPVILLTALTGKAQELRGLKLGADDYLSKPFDVTILQQRVKSILNNRAIIREKALKIITPGKDDDIVLEDNELNDRFLKDIIDIARKNVGNEKFSRDDFALAMNISPSLLYKKTKALTGLSPTDFIRSVRLEHALKLLKQKKYSITEVSELCGFSNVGYFGTVFRRYYGKSPSQVK
jgi:signal transduction histidine kinase/DNA-binding response OmpR family regulator